MKTHEQGLEDAFREFGDALDPARAEEYTAQRVRIVEKIANILLEENAGTWTGVFCLVTLASTAMRQAGAPKSVAVGSVADMIKNIYEKAGE